MTRGPRDRRRRAGIVAGTVALGCLAVALIVFGVVGIPSTVSAGGQASVCGMRVGITGSAEGVHLPGVEGLLGEGDRARIAPLCVVEIVRLEATPADPDDDGGSARVDLRWRLW